MTTTLAPGSANYFHGLLNPAPFGTSGRRPVSRSKGWLLEIHANSGVSPEPGATRGEIPMRSLCTGGLPMRTSPFELRLWHPKDKGWAVRAARWHSVSGPPCVVSLRRGDEILRSAPNWCCGRYDLGVKLSMHTKSSSRFPSVFRGISELPEARDLI